jgi:hypothetical protein
MLIFQKIHREDAEEASLLSPRALRLCSAVVRKNGRKKAKAPRISRISLCQTKPGTIFISPLQLWNRE